MKELNRHIVITSISGPTKAVKKFANLKGWQLIVVGDKKTPKNWQYKNVLYLSPKNQEKSSYKIIKHLPWNNYARKNLGYLEAISSGADVILESDDDNIPLPNHSVLPFEGKFRTLYGKEFVNTYSYFTDKFIWPRGYPLKSILDTTKPKVKQAESKIGIWQFLADGDPDVDAIYRLTLNKLVYFNRSKPLVLDRGTLSPINSQNTLFKKEFFPLLYLPAYVNFRFTDILRGFIAQPILWEYGYRIGFATSTVVQERNEHDYLDDFESEIPVFLHAHKVPQLISRKISKRKSVSENILIAYKELLKHGIVEKAEIKLLEAWVADLGKLGIQ